MSRPQLCGGGEDRHTGSPGSAWGRGGGRGLREGGEKEKKLFCQLAPPTAQTQRLLTHLTEVGGESTAASPGPFGKFCAVFFCN